MLNKLVSIYTYEAFVLLLAIKKNIYKYKHKWMGLLIFNDRMYFILVNIQSNKNNKKETKTETKKKKKTHRQCIEFKCNRYRIFNEFRATNSYAFNVLEIIFWCMLSVWHIHTATQAVSSCGSLPITLDFSRISNIFHDVESTYWYYCCRKRNCVEMVMMPFQIECISDAITFSLFVI